MAHGWDSYFHNGQPLSSKPGTLKRTSQSDGAFPQHVGGYIRRNDYPSTGVDQSALRQDPNLNMNYCRNNFVENSSSEYHKYYDETQWLADKEHMDRNYMQQSISGYQDFTVAGLPTSRTHLSSYGSDVQGLKQDSGLLPTSHLGSYSNVRGHSDQQACEIRPSCKFMPGNTFLTQEPQELSKPTTSDFLFPESGSMTLHDKSFYYNSSVADSIPPSQMKAGENQDVDCPNKMNVLETEKNASKCNLSSTTSCLLDSADDGAAHNCYDGFQSSKQDYPKKVSRVEAESNYSIAESMAQIKSNDCTLPKVKEPITSSPLTTFHNLPELVGKKKSHNRWDQTSRPAKPGSTHFQVTNTVKEIQDKSKVKECLQEVRSFETHTYKSHESPTSISDEKMDVDDHRKEDQEDTCHTLDMLTIQKLSPDYTVHVPSDQTLNCNGPIINPDRTSPKYSFLENVPKGLCAGVHENHTKDIAAADLPESQLQSNEASATETAKQTNEAEKSDTNCTGTSNLDDQILNDSETSSSSDQSKQSNFQPKNLELILNSEEDKEKTLVSNSEGPCPTRKRLDRETENNLDITIGATASSDTQESNTDVSQSKEEKIDSPGSSEEDSLMSSNPTDRDSVASCDDPLFLDKGSKNDESAQDSCPAPKSSNPLKKNTQESSLEEDNFISCNAPLVDCNENSTSSTSQADTLNKNSSKCLKMQTNPTSSGIKSPSHSEDRTGNSSRILSENLLKDITDEIKTGGDNENGSKASKDNRDESKTSEDDKTKSCFEADLTNTDTRPMFEKELAASINTTSPDDVEFRSKAPISVSNCVESSSQPFSQDCTHSYPKTEHTGAKRDSSKIFDPPTSGSKASINEEPSVRGEDLFLNVQKSIEELDSLKADFPPPDVHCEPLSEEDSASDAGDTDYFNEKSVTKLEVLETNKKEETAPKLKHSSQMRKQLHPVVVLRSSESTDETSTLYECGGCQHTASNVDSLVDHHSRNHVGVSFKFCQTCNVYLVKTDQWKRHTCGVKNEMHQLLNTTPKKKKRVHGNHKCYRCNLVFGKILHFVKHMRTHTGKTPYQCNQCGTYFSQPGCVVKHQRTPGRCKPTNLSEAKPYSVTRTETESQMDMDPSNPPDEMKECYVKLFNIFQKDCHLCGKTFDSAQAAKRHIHVVHKSKERRHSVDNATAYVGDTNVRNIEEIPREFKCPMCTRSFDFSYNLARHVRYCVKHEILGGKGRHGDKYICPLCKGAFTSTSNRSRHISIRCLRYFLTNLRKKTTQETKQQKPEKESVQILSKNTEAASTPFKVAPRHKCKYCPAVFSYASGKYTHQKKHELYKLTGKVVRYKNSFLPFTLKSEVSSSAVPKESTPQSQTSKDGSCPAFTCHFCDRAFSQLDLLNKHVRCHRGERPYRCTDCHKVFKKRAYLVGHKKMHQKKIQCIVCKKILPTIGELIQHRQEHLEKGMLKCPYCNLQFQYPAFLLRHVKTHKVREEMEVSPKVEALVATPQPSEDLQEEDEPKQAQCFLCDEVLDASMIRRHCLSHISKSSRHQCPCCKKVLSHHHNLLRHMILHFTDVPFSCNTCGEQFDKGSLLKLHTKTCSQNAEAVAAETDNTQKLYYCSICPRTFKKKNRWLNHLEAHKRNSLHYCSTCTQYFGHNHIGAHLRQCKQTPAPPTPVKSTITKPSPVQVVKEKPTYTDSSSKFDYKCPYCEEVFRYRSYFLRHLVKHTGVQPFACNYCNLRFRAETTCLNHENSCKRSKVKTNDKPTPNALGEASVKNAPNSEVQYKCKFCTKTFLKARNLRNHILTHNDVKPYQCKVCDSCFSRHDHLKVHQARCRSIKKRLELRIPKISLRDIETSSQGTRQTKQLGSGDEFQCEICMKTLPNQSRLSRHFNMFHGSKPHKCKNCGSGFTHARTLRHHIKFRRCRTHTQETQSNQPLRANQPNEQVHLHGIKKQLMVKLQPFVNKDLKYVCSYCPRAFKKPWLVRNHMRLHTGEKPYACDDCGERFIRLDYLKRHQRKCKKNLYQPRVLCEKCGGFFPENKIANHKKVCSVNPSSPGVSQDSQATPKSPPKGFSCAYCTSRFLLFSQLQEHFLSAHKVETMKESASAAPLQQLLSNIPSVKEEPTDDGYEEEQTDASSVICSLTNPASSESSEQFVCLECNLTFTNKAGLAGHQRVHTKEPPFTCKTCGRGFWNKHLLRNHYRKCRSIVARQKKVQSKSRMSRVVPREELSESDNASYSNSSEGSPEAKSQNTKVSSQEKKTVSYQCSECEQSFTDGLLLISHLEAHGREELEKNRNVCTICKRTFSTPSNLNKHKKMHHSARNYSGGTIPREFASEPEVEKHKKPYPCRLCHKSFWTRPKLREHFTTSHADVVFKCQFCSKAYAVKKSLQRHYKKFHPKEWKEVRDSGFKKGYDEQLSSSQVSVTNDSDEDESSSSDSGSDSAPYFPCHVCGKTFPTSESLEDHQLCHLGEKPHECSECGKCFFQASQLLQHQRTHKEELKCQTCGRGFVTLFALRNHKHTHGKNRPHRCAKCDLSFAGPLHLAEHMSTHREDNFPCDICNKVFQCKSSREEHRKSHSKSGNPPSPLVSDAESVQSDSTFANTEFKYRCGICHERYRNPEELSEHGCLEAQERIYSCTDCNKHFLHSSHLKKHKNTNHPPGPQKDFPCTECNSSFSSAQAFLVHLKDHIEAEKGIKQEESSNAYSCPVCYDCFDGASELNNHFTEHVKDTPKTTQNQCPPHQSDRRSPTQPAQPKSSISTGDQHSALSKPAVEEKLRAKNHTGQTSEDEDEEEEEEVDVTGDDVFKCSVCTVEFSSKSSLLEHQNQEHPSSKKFKCDECGKGFGKMMYLRKHESRHRKKDAALAAPQPAEEKKKIKCLRCNLSVSSIKELSRHMRTHAEKEVGSFRCDMCYMSFSHRAQLKQHQESHVGNIVYECDECDKAFAFPHLLDEHAKIHAESSK